MPGILATDFVAECASALDPLQDDVDLEVSAS